MRDEWREGRSSGSSEVWGAPEVWGGIECTHVRVGDGYRDQIVENGHRARRGDLERIAALGIRVLRYPVLWASVERGGRRDWRWTDARMARLRALGITPVAGFLHHGLGPGDISPLDDGFDAAFGDYAQAVARRYPWLRMFTPINEPVTTARFNCLYGVWHPHLRDEGAFLRMVFGSARATALAMARIRAVIPRARLVQTEDVGRVFAGPGLGYQADYENLRRFLFFDLICGRVDPSHGFWRRLVAAGIGVADLQALCDAPCPPDIIGIDQYLTSDRYLDPDLGAHPHTRPGGNGRDRYVDEAAVHVDALKAQCGVIHRIREVHARYGLPIALTEVHNGSTREEQLRWLAEAWDAAQVARGEGIAVKAVSVWSLLGTTDWNSLLVTRAGHYECGAFDVRTTPPRLTALGAAVAQLCETGAMAHPVLERPGWWHGEVDAATEALFSVQGDEVLVMALREACAVRRLTLGPRPRLGVIRAERMADGRRVRFCFSGGLVVETPAQERADAAVHAALDLMLDGETGHLRLSRLAMHGQYRIERQPAGAQRRVPVPAPFDRRAGARFQA